MHTVLPDRKCAVKPTVRAHGAYPHSRASGFQRKPSASPLIAESRSLPASSDAASMLLSASGRPVPRQSFANWRAWGAPQALGNPKESPREIFRTAASRRSRDRSLDPSTSAVKA